MVKKLYGLTPNDKNGKRQPTNVGLKEDDTDTSEHNEALTKAFARMTPEERIEYKKRIKRLRGR